MLSIQRCKRFSHALGEYLRQADYYSEGMKVEGRCFGQLCPAVGLTEGAVISDPAFERVADNHHAETGIKLTARQKSTRRAGYDAAFNAPKSVSVQAFIAGDDRLLTAHECAVAETLRELETFACHQTGQGINKRYVPTGKLAGAVFRHGESRALDPHLHSHAFIFNATQTQSPARLLALESSVIFARTNYLTAVYRNVLAREVSLLGYGLSPAPHGFELEGVPPELLVRFSKRAEERDQAIATREAELGRELSRDEIAVLVRENRAKKQYELTPAEVRQHQMAQVNEAELRQLHALRTEARSSPERISLEAALTRARDHIFERWTVVPVHDFMAEVIRQSYGQHALADVKSAVTNRANGLLHAEGNVSTQAALDLERALVDRVNAGSATHNELGFLAWDASERCGSEQFAALEKILNSKDRVTVFRGRAGTGKTTTLALAIEGIARINREVACFAPSTQAVEVLKRDGAEQLRAGRNAAGTTLANAETLQRLLVDPALQASIAHKLLVVDEYGLLSLRQLKDLVDLAEKRRARLLLVGDSAQHKSVEAGDAARILERETRATVAELRDIKRQSANPAYRAAAQALASGDLAEGLRRLDRMGAIVEVENPTDRRVQMVAEWFAASRETKVVRTRHGDQMRPKAALMIAPTWTEIDALNTHARATLRTHGVVTGADADFTALRAKDWTKAQQRDARNYQPGDWLVAHKATKHFQKHDELRVVRREKRRLIVTRGTEEISVSARQSGLAWTVCEERTLPVATGDRLRLRAVSRAQSADGQIRRLANGTTVIARGLDAHGRLVIADGSTLLNRQLVHGYAMTSHAGQGLTVDKVFIAGAISREGLYVSATRGREAIRVFVSDREAFLDATSLKSEARMSALEFVRTLKAALPPADLPRWLLPLQLTMRYLASGRRQRISGDDSSSRSHRNRNTVRERAGVKI